MRTRIAGGLFPATLRVPGRVTTLNENGKHCVFPFLATVLLSHYTPHEPLLPTMRHVRYLASVPLIPSTCIERIGHRGAI